MIIIKSQERKLQEKLGNNYSVENWNFVDGPYEEIRIYRIYRLFGIPFFRYWIGWFDSKNKISTKNRNFAQYCDSLELNTTLFLDCN